MSGLQQIMAAIDSRRGFAAYKWLAARRLTQTMIIGLFLLGPATGIWIIKGTPASSLLLGVLPLTDPYVLLQSLFGGHVPETAALTGAGIIVAFYLLVGGRAYCAWVCPINMVTDTAAWCRRKLRIQGTALSFVRSTRLWILGLTLLSALVTGTIIWELVNPVSLVFRGLIFGLSATWAVVIAVFLFDLVVSRRGWCGHLCPMGAVYGLIGTGGVLRISAANRTQCDDCMDCFEICPEPQVIKPALKGAEQGVGPVILASSCTNCGRCIDVCTQNVFRFATRFNNTWERA
jgi:ferredoxin-type protein NapH